MGIIFLERFQRHYIATKCWRSCTFSHSLYFSVESFLITTVWKLFYLWDAQTKCGHSCTKLLAHWLHFFLSLISWHLSGGMVGQVYCGQPVWGWCEANWSPQEYGGLWHGVCGLIWDISCTLHYLYVYPLFYWSSLLLVEFNSGRSEAVPSGWFWFLYLSTGGLSHGC